MFLDVTSAFYSVVSEIAVGAAFDGSDEHIAKLLSLIGLPNTALQDLAALLAQPSVLESVGVDPHLRSIVAESQRDSWSIFGGSPHVVAATLGTRLPR